MPVVFRAFEDASRTLELLAASLQTAAFDRELMARRAGGSLPDCHRTGGHSGACPRPEFS
jgi:hypothetical protein